jgi:hypothetical protein
VHSVIRAASSALATAMIAKSKPPPHPAPTKLPVTPVVPTQTPDRRWVRTQRYGWDKGGNRGGRR